MPNTTNQQLPYPASSAAPNVPADLQTLAQSVEKKVVQVFASAADRSTRMPSPTEGMMCWLQDVNRFDYYTGSTWARVAERIGDGAFDNAPGTTTSTTFGNLSGVSAGPVVSVPMVTAGVVAVHCTALISNTVPASYCLMGIGLSGATTFGTLQVAGLVVGVAEIASGVRLYTVNAGTTVFTATYRVGAGTGTFADRVVWAVPVG